MGQRKRTPRKPKARSQHRRGGDRVSVKAKTAQIARDAEAYRMRAQGFGFAVIAGALGVGEEAARTAYWRAARSQSLATVEEARALAFAEIEQRRQTAWVEIRKRQAALGTDGKKLFDVSELRMLDGILNDCARRQAALMGLDSPIRVGWAGAPLGGDTLTRTMLDNLSEEELESLWSLIEKARDGNAAIEVESHAINGNGHGVAPAIAAPVAEPPAPPAVASAPVTVASEPAKPAPVAASDRERQMARAEELIALLNNHDPVTGIRDPALRDRLIRELNGLAARFGRPMWQEPREWGQ